MDRSTPNRRLPRVAIPLLALGLAAPAAGAWPGSGEISLFGATASGSYGRESDTRSQWLTVRYATGTDLQLRVDLSMVRTDTFSDVRFTALGAMPTGDRRRSGAHLGSGSGGSIGEGPASSAGVAEPVAGATESGLGDLYVALSKRVAGGGVRLYRLDTGLEVKVPTADAEKYLGTGEWDVRVGCTGEYRFWSAALYGGLGWNRLGDPSWATLDDVLDGFLGVESNPLFGERLVLGGWVEAWQEAVAGTGDRAALGIGLRTTGKVRWRMQLRAGLTDASPDLGVLFGVSFGIAPPGPGARGPRS